MVNWMDTTVFAINVYSYRGLFFPNKQEKKNIKTERKLERVLFCWFSGGKVDGAGDRGFLIM